MNNSQAPQQAQRSVNKQKQAEAGAEAPPTPRQEANRAEFEAFLNARPQQPEYPDYAEGIAGPDVQAITLPPPEADFDPEVIIVGAGLAGLVAAYEASRVGRRVLLLDQENAASIGGQAYWSLGGLFLVDSPEQRRIGIRDNLDLAWRDWEASAGFDREEDYWPRQWARAYVAFAAGAKRRYLHDLGLRFVPTVGWAERGGADLAGHGNSVPRFHVAKGTGTEVVRIFLEPLRKAAEAGYVRAAFRHRVDELLRGGPDGRAVVGVAGSVLEEATGDRSVASSRTAVGEFRYHAQAVLLSTGGIGGNPEKIAELWPTERLGPAPQRLICGVPEHVDGRMIDIAAQQAGAQPINRDRMWHYTEGVRNFAPIWPRHAIRIIPGPSTLWLDAHGNRMPHPLYPGFHTNAAIKAITQTGHHYSWFVLDREIASREFILSGSEQNPDITSKEISKMARRILAGMPAGVQAFIEQGADWVQANTLEELVDGMNALLEPGEPELDLEQLRELIVAFDGQMDNPFAKDGQVQAIHNARRVISDRLARLAKPHKLLRDSGAGTHSWCGSGGPLIAVKIHLMTRKTLGGLLTDLDSRCLDVEGNPIPGLFAAGEAAGFGGGGVHGYNSLEGTFLGGCIFSGMRAGRAMSSRRAD